MPNLDWYVQRIIAFLQAGDARAHEAIAILQARVARGDEHAEEILNRVHGANATATTAGWGLPALGGAAGLLAYQHAYRAWAERQHGIGYGVVVDATRKAAPQVASVSGDGVGFNLFHTILDASTLGMSAAARAAGKRNGVLGKFIAGFGDPATLTKDVKYDVNLAANGGRRGSAASLLRREGHRRPYRDPYYPSAPTGRD